MTPKTPRKTSPLPAVIAIFVFVVLAAVFIGELGDVSGGGAAEPTAVKTLVAVAYEDELAVLLADADPSRGPELVNRYGCLACHDGPGAQNKLAPLWAGIGTRAATQRPPLSAAAYIYESIIHPTAYEIEGYSGNMPVIYSRLIPPEDLGSIVAYLLMLTED